MDGLKLMNTTVNKVVLKSLNYCNKNLIDLDTIFNSLKYRKENVIFANFEAIRRIKNKYHGVFTAKKHIKGCLVEECQNILNEIFMYLFKATKNAEILQL